MGVERPKKKVQLWKKAIVHFALCFVMGFFTGFAPTGGKSSIFSTHHAAAPLNNSQPSSSPERHSTPQDSIHIANRSLASETPTPIPQQTKDDDDDPEENPEQEPAESPNLAPRRLVIVVTPTSSGKKHQEVFLRRLANTIKLVAPPLLWIVVEGQSGNSDKVSQVLRKTGIMYRHLVSKKNFTDPEAELDHQRNLALRHIELHKLSGVVHFAGLSNVYDLGFFDELRDIEEFGAWPVALLSPNKNKVIIEGPVCDSSQVIGWHLKKMINESETTTPPIHISSFAFNSSILWDPERWGRSSSIQHTSQNSVKFVKQVALEDETKLKGIPPEDCSKIRLWRLHHFAD